MTAKTQQRVKRVRRYDPERKEKIVDKAFELIAECGVAGITHRLIAGRAGVPLGSMTYHFKNMDELLFRVFSRFAQESAVFVTSRMERAENPEAAIECFASIMTDSEWVNRQNMAVLYEFYSLATREPAYRQILTDWSNTTRHSLERFFRLQRLVHLMSALKAFCCRTSLILRADYRMRKSSLCSNVYLQPINIPLLMPQQSSPDVQF